MWQMVKHLHCRKAIEPLLQQGKAVAEKALETAQHEIDREAIAQRWQSLQDAAASQRDTCEKQPEP